PEGDPTALRDQLEAEIEREAGVIAERRVALAGTAATEAEARELAAAARAQAQAAHAAAAKAGEASSNVAVRTERLTQRRAELGETWAQLQELRPDAVQEVDSCRELWRQAGEQLTALDEPRSRHAADDTGQAVVAWHARAH